MKPRATVKPMHLPARVLATLMLLLGLTVANTPAAGESSEYAVKAAYLYKIAPFVDWPPSSFASASSPVILCIVGDDPFGPLIDQITAGQFDGQRPITIRRMSVAHSASPCHIMYLAGSGLQSVRQGLDAIEGEPVLTVTDADSGPHGIINFVIVNHRVAFDIDQDAADDSDLVISSKLLSLARSVKRAKG
jgi:YfiR/HmsC-like